MSPPAARTRAAHLGPERRRPLVLDAALGLFAERGYAGTSMQTIAAAAGVTKPVLYACFPGKLELFEALLGREEERLLGQIAEALPDKVEADTLEEALVEGFTAYLRLAAATSASWKLMFYAEHGGDRSVAARMARTRQVARIAIATLSEELMRSEGARGDVARRAKVEANVLVATAEAAVRVMLAHPDEWTPEALGRMLGRGAAAAHPTYSRPAQ